MKMRTAAGALALSLLAAGLAWAVPKGKTLTWESSRGQVVFSGTAHADRGLTCNDCHKELFKRKHGTARMTMKELNEGKHCGACHNGKDAFDTASEAGCKRCHRGA